MWFLLAVACNENNLIAEKDGTIVDEGDVAPDILVTPSAIDFGTVEVGSTHTAAITITNEGSAALAVSSLSVRGGSVELSWSNLGTPLVPPGGTTETVLTWEAASGRSLSDTFRVTSDDPDEPHVDVPITGTLPAGAIAITPEDYDFGTIDVGAEANTVLVVANVGDGPLTIDDWSYTANDGDLTLVDPGALAATPVTFAPGQSTEVVVRYAPSGEGPDEGNLTVTSDDPDLTIAGAQQVGNGHEDDPCDGFTQTVELFLTADDAWQGWIDNTAFTGPNSGAWNAFDTFEWELECGDHALALYATDTGMAISGVIAVVKVEGAVRFVSGPSNWTMLDTAPPSDWTDPAFDDSSWYIPEVCANTSIWGSTPQPFYDLGAEWIWWTSSCTSLGEAWFRLNFTVP